MANFKRSSKQYSSKPNISRNCKKHPKHKQSPGVCSLCLRAKLSKLPASNSRTTFTTTGRGSSCNRSSSYISSLSSYYSSSSSSSAYSSSSPINGYHFTREGSKSSISLFFTRSNNVLQKSRSLAFVPRIRKSNKETCSSSTTTTTTSDLKKKYGFWSKLLI